MYVGVKRDRERGKYQGEMETGDLQWRRAPLPLVMETGNKGKKKVLFPRPLQTAPQVRTIDKNSDACSAQFLFGFVHYLRVWNHNSDWVTDVEAVIFSGLNFSSLWLLQLSLCGKILFLPELTVHMKPTN